MGPNPVICVFTREREGEAHRADTQDCQRPPEARKGIGTFLPRAFSRSVILSTPRFQAPASTTLRV